MTTSALFHRFPAPAKLNLFLHVNGQLENGYHELQTLFQFINWCDYLEFCVTHNKEVELLTPIDGVANEDNLIVKAARLLQKHSGIDLGVKIKLEKNLPMGGGIGGGSSDAATVLLALNHLWQLNLPLSTLAELGLTLGADVPIFIYGRSAFAEGVGEKLTAYDAPTPWYLVSCPDVEIGTPEVFGAPDLPRNTKKIRLETLDLSKTLNDCQTVVTKRYPEVANLLAWLIEYAPSKMTGTGACIFSEFRDEESAEIVQEKLPSNVLSVVTKGNNRSPMHAALEAAHAKIYAK